MMSAASSDPESAGALGMYRNTAAAATMAEPSSASRVTVSSYHSNFFAISVLQTVLVVLVLCGVVAVGS